MGLFIKVVGHDDLNRGFIDHSVKPFAPLRQADTVSDHRFDFDRTAGQQADSITPGGGVVGHMTNDAFVPRGNVVDGEIERFETHAHANHFPVGAQHFDRLFEGNISAGAFDNQAQVVFTADLLATRDHIFGRTVDDRCRPQLFGNREAYRDILFQSDHDDVHCPHDARHLHGKEP